MNRGWKRSGIRPLVDTVDPFYSPVILTMHADTRISEASTPQTSSTGSPLASHTPDFGIVIGPAYGLSAKSSRTCRPTNPALRVDHAKVCPPKSSRCDQELGRHHSESRLSAVERRVQGGSANLFPAPPSITQTPRLNHEPHRPATSEWMTIRQISPS